MAYEGRLHTDAKPVDDLVEDVHQGLIRIPSFQRGLRWQRSDVIRLFDSIVRGYPIGNLLLWRRHGDEFKNMPIGALRIDAPSTDSALFVVDGQQRLTSLANALSDEGQKDPRFALAYDVERERFVQNRNVTVTEIPLPIIFDLTRLLSYFNENPELLSQPEFIQRANRTAKAIREFRVPVYIVEQSDESVLRDIFDRMNNYGRKLTRAEVFSALHEAGDDNGDSKGVAHDLNVIADQVHAQTGFGVVDENTVLLAVLARRKADISRDIRREFDPPSTVADRQASDFPGETPAEARRAVVEAMVAAVEFLQNAAGAPHLAMLPYRYLLVVLTRFFSHFPDPGSGSIRNLRRWFWRAAVLGPQVTKGNITFATRSMCERIRPGDELGSIEGLLDIVSGPSRTDLEVVDFRTNYATTRIMVACLWDLRPARLNLGENGEVARYGVNDLLGALGEQNTALGVTPAVYSVGVAGKDRRSLPGNRILLADSPEAQIESPFDALWRLARDGGDSASAALLSHGVTADASERMLAGDAEGFIDVRQETLTEALRSFIARNAEWSFEDTPSLDLLVVDDDPEERDDAMIAPAGY
ncbi:DUF262 domain-containing protein [Microbacterium sp. BG28]|uniref:DUF262 domain-containing protein n=1 Tax=Microbacterium sp. BG28 TaxID=3097356 RepID=UPI002A59AD03|nr:DUF262 domain-containing protein [Microbacterium sp. BG28]MDY0830551.1 DUF262 domain-containing protein [Microbacterium sp. BG28]